MSASGFCALAQHRVEVGSGGRFACLQGFFLPAAGALFLAVAKIQIPELISNLRSWPPTFILTFLASVRTCVVSYPSLLLPAFGKLLAALFF